MYRRGGKKVIPVEIQEEIAKCNQTSVTNALGRLITALEHVCKSHEQLVEAESSQQDVEVLSGWDTENDGFQQDSNLENVIKCRKMFRNQLERAKQFYTMVSKLQRLVKDDVQQRNMVTRVLRYFDDEDYNMNDYLILKKEYQRFIDENNIEEKNLMSHVRDLKNADYDSYIPPVNTNSNSNPNTANTTNTANTCTNCTPGSSSSMPIEQNINTIENNNNMIKNNNDKILYPSVNDKSSPLLSPKASARNLTEAIKRNMKNNNNINGINDIDNNNENNNNNDLSSLSTTTTSTTNTPITTATTTGRKSSSDDCTAPPLTASLNNNNNNILSPKSHHNNHSTPTTPTKNTPRKLMRAPSPIKPNPVLSVDTKLSGISITANTNTINSLNNTSVPQLPPIPSVKSVRSSDDSNENSYGSSGNSGYENENKKKAIELYELYDFIRKNLEKLRDVILKEFDLKQKLTKLRHPTYIIQYETTLSELVANKERILIVLTNTIQSLDHESNHYRVIDLIIQTLPGVEDGDYELREAIISDVNSQIKSISRSQKKLAMSINNLAAIPDDSNKRVTSVQQHNDSKKKKKDITDISNFSLNGITVYK